MRHSDGRTRLSAAIAVVLWVLQVPAVQARRLFPAESGVPATAAQLQRGQDAYALGCANCHGAALEGTQFGPTLRGPVFEGHWRGRARSAFSELLRTTMPPGKLGALDGETYAAIEAYLLEPSPPGGNAAAASSPAAAQSAPRSARPAAESASMMGPMQRRADDPVFQAALRARQAKLAGLSDVTDRMLQTPPAGDWLMWRRGYDGLGSSPLTQINRANVSRLRVAWSWSLPVSPNELTPLVHDGVLFISSGASIQALDGATGDLLWQYVRSLPSGGAAGQSHGKAMALYGDALIAPTGDGHVIALDARSGKLIWDHEVIPMGPASGGLALNGAPLVVRGTVILGVSLGVNYPGGCFIVGLNVENGAEQWRFHTIARPGEPGGDSWNGAPVEERFGGGVWTAGSYDPELDLVYFGVGNTYDTATLLEPRPGLATVGNNDGLYTDATVALRPEDGKLVWHYQHQKRDVWDLDWVFEQSLLTLKQGGAARRLVVTGGKTALFDALDAKTGQFVFSADLGLQNLVLAVDPVTGEKSVNPKLEPEAGVPKLLCPNSIGARNWFATAVDAKAAILYVPLLENCADYTYLPRSAELTAKGGIDMRYSARSPPDHDGKFGRLVALDLRSRKVLWTQRQRMPFASAALVTAGGLVFSGDVDRYFSAYDAATGKRLWRTRLGAAAESFPVSFAAAGKQYIGVVVGGGSPMGAASRAFVPESLAPAAGVSLVVFEMP